MKTDLELLKTCVSCILLEMQKKENKVSRELIRSVEKTKNTIELMINDSTISPKTEIEKPKYLNISVADLTAAIHIGCAPGQFSILLELTEEQSNKIAELITHQPKNNVRIITSITVVQ